MLGSAKTKSPSLLWPAEWKAPAPFSKIQIFIPKSTEGEGGLPVWELSLEKKLFFSASLSLEIETETKSFEVVMVDNFQRGTQLPGKLCLLNLDDFFESISWLLQTKELGTFTRLVKLKGVTWFWHFRASDLNETFSRSSLVLNVSRKVLLDE